MAATTPSPLLRLPPEVWVHVVEALLSLDADQPPVSLARLSCACRHTHDLIEHHGWAAYLRRYPVIKTLATPLPRSTRLRAAESYRCRTSWDHMRTRVHRSLIAAPVRGKQRVVLDPLLLLGSECVLLFAHSHVLVWPARQMSSPRGLDTNRAFRFELLPFGSGTAGPMQTISAVCLVDPTGGKIVLGRIDGSLQEFHLPLESIRHRGTKKETLPLTAVADLVQPPQIPQGAPARTRIQRHPQQALSYADGVLATLSRSGRIRLWAHDQSWTRVWAMDLRNQAWTCLLDREHRWLAVGTKGTECLLLFPLAGDLSLLPPMALSTLHGPLDEKDHGVSYFARVGEGRPCSVFALLQHKNVLLAGFYDGVVRTYDLGRAPWSLLYASSSVSPDHWPVPVYPVAGSSSGTGTATPAEEEEPFDRSTTIAALTPINHYRDRFDDSAIYSLSLGTGYLFVGMSTSGVVKMYPTSNPAPTESLARLTEQNPGSLVERTTMAGTTVQLSTTLPPGSMQGRTLYCGYPSHSPIFSLVADWDRVLGVTDTHVFDLRIGSRQEEDRGRPAPRGGLSSAAKPQPSTPVQPQKPLPPRPRSPDYLEQRRNQRQQQKRDDLTLLPFVGSLESVEILYA